MRTLERWEQENGLLDKRKDADKIIANKLTIEEREVILAIANSKEYRDLSNRFWQITNILYL